MKTALDIVTLAGGIIVILSAVGGFVGVCVYAGRIIERLDRIVDEVGGLSKRVAHLEGQYDLEADEAAAQDIRRRKTA